MNLHGITTLGGHVIHHQVANTLSRIKTNKAAGPDEMPNWIPRDYATNSSRVRNLQQQP